MSGYVFAPLSSSYSPVEVGKLQVSESSLCRIEKIFLDCCRGFHRMSPRTRDAQARGSKGYHYEAALMYCQPNSKILRAIKQERNIPYVKYCWYCPNASCGDRICRSFAARFVMPATFTKLEILQTVVLR